MEICPSPQSTVEALEGCDAPSGDSSLSDAGTSCQWERGDTPVSEHVQKHGDEQIRVGFILGKEYDLVDGPIYAGEAKAFLSDLPAKYRKSGDAKRISLDGCSAFGGSAGGEEDQVSADVAIAWYIHKHHRDIAVDFVFPQDISLQRLQSNLVNYVIGYDVIDAILEGPAKHAEVLGAFRECGNMMPSWEVQEAIYLKSRYMSAAIRAGVPMAPTLFAFRGRRSPDGLLSEVKARCWETFVMKQSYSAFSCGFQKFSVAECEARPEILEEYFERYVDGEEFIVQEFVEGFRRNLEIRCFWFSGEFLYAIANRATVSSDGEDVGIIPQEEISPEALEQAKRVGRLALGALPQLRTPDGQPIGMTLIRTDIGCSDSQLLDKDTDWAPDEKTYFLNEIEYGGTTYFVRALKFDSIPMWAGLYASKSREINKNMASAASVAAAAGELVPDSAWGA